MLPCLVACGFLTSGSPVPLFMMHAIMSSGAVDCQVSLLVPLLAPCPQDQFIQANPHKKTGIRKKDHERPHSTEDKHLAWWLTAFEVVNLLEDWHKKMRGIFLIVLQSEVPQLCWLTVKIISMKNLRKADLLTLTDCYVKLWLPTASRQEARTRTVRNCRNPVWNETFHFMIQSEVKNILELTVCDEDTFTPDDQLLTVRFDVAKIQLGEKVQLNFKLNPEKEEELEVEFLLENIPGVSENIITNGVLVSREVSCLEVKVDDTKKKTPYTRRDFTFAVKGSYEETQDVCIDPCCSQGGSKTTKFHYIKHSQPRLHMTLPKEHFFCGHSSTSRKMDVTSPLAVPLPPLDLGKEVTVMRGESYEVSVKEEDGCKNLDLRLGFDLCAEEQDFICKRKKVVAAALKSVLQLDEDLEEDEVCGTAS
ncbi:hypothetical protein Q9233_005311 [Columba guinea]|nr:hypothetical protein Q9233_005311 [Columba guinea]